MRYTGARALAAATVHTVRNADAESRHFTVDGERVLPCESYEDGFGSMLLEAHPTRGFDHQGKWCRTHRYSLCFAPYELYEPLTAEQTSGRTSS